MRKQELHPHTAVINKNQKNISKKAKMDALTWLAAHFPQSFDNSIRIRPLKTGIMTDILNYAEQASKAGISKSKLREAVVIYTRRLDYLACLKAREPRIDLDGNPVQEVSDEEALHAANKIKKRIEKSVRNSKKIFQTANQPKVNAKSDFQRDNYFPEYPTRSNSYTQPDIAGQTAKVSTVIVKHKTSKQFDPDAVARLKEKLGISKSAQTKKETIE